MEGSILGMRYVNRRFTVLILVVFLSTMTSSKFGVDGFMLCKVMKLEVILHDRMKNMKS